MIKENNIDKVTNLMTRDEFLSRAENLINNQSKIGGEICVAYIDLDNFKFINDTYGHIGGDEILSQIAYILKENLRPSDILSRFGGDQFAVAFPSTTAETTFILLEEIRKLIFDTHFEIALPSKGREEIKTTVSISFACYPRDAATLEEIQRKADQGIYRAKKEGRNRVCLPQEEKMVPKSNYYTTGQLERLAQLSKTTKKSEAFLLREALDLLMQKYRDELENAGKANSFTFEVGKDLISLIDPSRDGVLLSEVVRMRERLQKDRGIVIPGIRFRDNLVELSDNEYRILVKGKEVKKGSIQPGDPKDVEMLKKELNNIVEENIYEI